jgi:hypothetical protein
VSEELYCKGVGGQLKVTSQKVVISHKGVLGVMSQGLKGDKEIRIDQISAIQIKRAGILTNGYIQFSFLGGSETKRGIWDATQDENSIMFKKAQEPEFLRAKDLIEQYQSRSFPVPSARSDLDELEKLAGLKDKGIINNLEFEAKKKQLLGI